MMYMCKSIPKENVVTMYDERVAELEHLLEKALNDHAGVMRMYEKANERYMKDTNILSEVLRLTADRYLDNASLASIITDTSYNIDDVISILEFHDAVPECMLKREFYVTVNIPVSVCMRIDAVDEDRAEEIACDLLDADGIESYDMEYSVRYDAEFTVEEM